MLATTIRADIHEALPSPDARYALAYSGGGDSLAMLAMLHDDPRLAGVLHVDHGLRDGSARDAVLASLQAEQLGHHQVTLRWEPGVISTGLQEKARRARYGLMGDWCRAHGVSHLVVAHHADDQAETVLMRVERGSGWRGAAGMQARSYGPVWPELAGITVLRPALGISRDALRAELGERKPVRDPSNENAAFTRVRARERLAAEPELRADMLDLAASMARGRAESALRLRQVLDDAHMTHEGQLTVRADIKPEQLQAILPAVGGQGGPADLSRIKAKVGALASGAAVSLGCGVIGQVEGGRLTLSRDPVAMTGRSDGHLAPTAERLEITAEPQVWDGRFLVSGRGGVLNPERRGNHVGFRILFGREVEVVNLVAERLQALIDTGQPPAT